MSVTRLHRSAGRNGQGTDGRKPEFVFADEGGRRWRVLRVVIVIAVAAVVTVLSAAAFASVVTPWDGSSFNLNTVTTRGTKSEVPAVGVGPVEHVLAVQRTATGEVWGTELENGSRVVQYDQDAVKKIGDAKYVVNRTGYEQPNAKTLTLTFDDGPDPATTDKLLDILGKEHVPATFFVQGKYVARHPQVVRRMAREGHTIGGHTVNHPDLFTVPRWREQYELVSTDRLVRAVAGVATNIWRMPYDDGENTEGKQQVSALLLGQHLGYEHIGYDFDTTDWNIDAKPGAKASDIALPDFTSGVPMTVLMHDAGGDGRELTVEYVRDYLIPAARANGYSFTTVQQSNAQLAKANVPVNATWADQTALVATNVLYVWPTSVLRVLFFATLFMAVGFGLLNAILAIVRYRRLRRRDWGDASTLPKIPVTVLLAAFNEETVIERTIRTVLRSEYPVTEVLVVDDGSSDSTADIVRSLAKDDPRVRLLQQKNTGKAAALNNGNAELRGDVVVTIDADTVVVPQTVGNLVRRFIQDPDGKLGAVAGVVRVGNRSTNVLTRWQALEYVSQIGVDRAAQSMLNAIAIVPGACAAWRRTALLDADGFKTDNLAEDADLALHLHELGWRVEQDDEAYAFTEAPETLDDLLKQRIRWTYGIMQAMWKHRRLLFSRRNPGIGFYVLPNYVLSLMIPLVLFPLTLVMTVVAVQNQGYLTLALGFGIFVLYQLVLSAIAVKLMNESRSHLLMVPMYRVIFEPLRAYLLYSTAFSALKGVRVKWNRVHRTGTIDSRLDRPVAKAVGLREPVAADHAVAVAMTGGAQ